MARPQKMGLDYFPMDVDFFSDRKIKRLMTQCGANGVAAYHFLLCEIYRTGYAIDGEKLEDLILDTSGAIGTDTAEAMRIYSCMIALSLFDKALAENGTLTSAAIQSRWQAAKKGSRRVIKVNAGTWLLPPDQTLDFIQIMGEPNMDNLLIPGKTPQLESFSGNNGGFSGNNGGFSGIYAQSKVKESKEKESKVDQSKVDQSKEKESKADQTRPKENKSEQSRPDQTKVDQSTHIADALSGALSGLAGKEQDFDFLADRADGYPRGADEVLQELESIETLPEGQARMIAQKFYVYYQLRDWQDKNGRPVKDWRKLAHSWAKNERPADDSSSDTESKPSPYAQFIYNIDE